MKEATVRVAVHRLRTRYRDRLRTQVAATLDDDESIDDELEYLRAAISGR